MVQLPLVSPRSDWRPPNLGSLPSWKGAARVALDIETHDPDLKKTGIGVRRAGRIVGVSFAVENHDPDRPALSFYLPIGHEGGDNLPREHVLAYLQEQARVFGGELVGANLPYDLDYLEEAGIVFNPRFFRDCLLAEPILDPLQFSYSLDNVLERNGLGGKETSLLYSAAQMFGLGTKDGQVKGNLHRLPGRHVGPYAEGDATKPLILLRAQERRIREEDRQDSRGASLWSAWDLESRLLPVLLRMRRRGVRIDNDQLDRVEAQTARIQEDALSEMSRLSGVKITRGDVNKARLIASAIEKVTGKKLPVTPTGLPTIKKEVLLEMEGHPVVDLYLKAKRYDKLRTTYIPQLREHQVKGRVHCTFNQARRDSDDGAGSSGTITYRLSAVDPSLQNQPIRDPEIGPSWRACYIPEDGEQWACLDFSQQEPRWILHFAELTNCAGASKAAQACRADPKWDYHTTNRDMIGWTGKEGRDKAKTIGLALAYRMGGPKLCRKLGLPTKWIRTASGRDIEVAGDEGQKILDEFGSRAPYIEQLMTNVEATAKERGYVRTVVGHRIRFPKALDGRPGYDWTYAAGNGLVQGSSAGQTKKAMVDADDAGIPLQLQVHDELNLSVSDPHTASHLAEIMTRAVPCNVPHIVEPKLATSWGTAK